MASNNSYGSEKQLMADDLRVGQILIEVEHGHWSNPTHTERPWRVDKILKTRVALTMMREVEGALVETALTERMIVRDGRIMQTMEGRSWKSGMSLYTEDDPHLPEVRANTKRSQIRLTAMLDAETAQKRLEPKTAERAIRSLQAYLDSVKDLAEGEE